MLFTLSVHQGTRYVVLVLSGHAFRAHLFGSVDFLASFLQETGLKAALVDMMAIEHHGSDEQATLVGHHLAERLKGVSRVAVAVAKDRYVGVADRVAQSKGINFRMFHDIQSAQDWLTSEEQADSNGGSAPP